MLEDDIDDLYDNAPCGFLSTLLDGTIAKVNATLLDWLGHAREDVVGRRRFVDLLAVGSRLYHETHLAPLLRMQGQVSGIALELLTADGTPVPVLVTSTVKTGGDGEPRLIRTTVFDARERRAYEQELLSARHRADQDRARLRLLVTGLQRSLLPATLAVPPGMATAAHYHMASPDEVGGDFYDLFPLPGDRWAFFLGDVRGKGIGAAAVTAAARYTLRAAAVYDPDPTAVLANLNAVLFQEYRTQAHRHCTVIFGVLEKQGVGYRATIAAGGHPPALLSRANGATDYQLTEGGALIGIMAEPRLATRTVRLDPGDTLILYSDGLTEARTGPHGERFGDEALRDYVRNQGPTEAAAAVRALVELLATFEEVEDDVAVMALSVPGRHIPTPAGPHPRH
ncbi:PP2C family protein-serine/threonine phosphatase [Paractinoplanes rishiriensis]|uniref:Histidine kinase n=1 Tax=Paractinoplanes rishiriensis TaxID=1050105 RepID=A0A919MU26_9ACTN|nr:SpoIIE family protein phosphatase [Actinoplanes rishiriensis]GIE94899.1 histidine kinase [Actinoplanes rishiriensis]